MKKAFLLAVIVMLIVTGCKVYDHLHNAQAKADSTRPETVHTNTKTVVQPIVKPTEIIPKLVSVPDTTQPKSLKYYAERASRERDTMFQRLIDLQDRFNNFELAQTQYNTNQGTQSNAILDEIRKRQIINLIQQNKSLKQENQKGQDAIQSQKTNLTLYVIIAFLAASWCYTMKLWAKEVDKNRRTYSHE